MQQRGSFTKAGMVFVRAAVLAAVFTQLLGPSKATRPAGSHPGHAYFEQPCCGHSHLRHHKGTFYIYIIITTNYSWTIFITSTLKKRGGS